MSAPQGIDAFIADVAAQAKACGDDRNGKIRFIQQISEDYAYVRMADLYNPYRFLGQAAGKPPKRFGREGFDPSLVDDDDPARHYTAFVFVGFWLPTSLSILVLWVWEILGFIRYKGVWSPGDIRLGYVGLRHGKQMRRLGPSILPELIRRDIKSP